MTLVAAPPAWASVIDLRAHSEAKLVGTARGGFMCRVAPGGDVNGDGEEDLLVAGVPGDRRGVVRVFFGPLPRGTTSLDGSPEHGFSINGGGEEDFADVAMPAGDVNGDGLGDVIVGAYLADGDDRGDSGRAYVVFGKGDNDDVDLADFDSGGQGDAGFRIDGPDTLSLAGMYVGGVGDTDGDGLSDVFVGAVFSGSAYLVRGKSDSLPVDLRTFDLGIQGAAGYRIDHPTPERSGDYNVVAAGDVNGDGRGDIALATARHSTDYDAWVVFGKADNVDVDVSNMGGYGFTMRGDTGEVGMGLSTAGDVNGDGKDDVLVGNPSEELVYVVFGRIATSTVMLDHLGNAGYRVVGGPAAEANRLGAYVSGGSDLDRDGRSDILVSAYAADHRNRRNSGSVYVLFGKAGTRALRLNHLGRRGIRLDGEKRWDHFGIVPAMPGDVTGDGRRDVVVGASVPRLRSAGQAHVISHRLLFRRR